MASNVRAFDQQSARAIVEHMEPVLDGAQAMAVVLLTKDGEIVTYRTCPARSAALLVGLIALLDYTVKRQVCGFSERIE